MSGARAEAPMVKGWCPGAYRPMASGDGLVVRVRPVMGEVTARQAIALCDVARTYGTGVLELTSRANIQIRGVSDAGFEAVIAALQVADLLDGDPMMEGRRNIVMTPDWSAGDETHGVALELLAALPQLPDLPAKFGYAIDTGAAPWVREAPADIRLERGVDGALILVADGADLGRPVTARTAVTALRELVAWFIETGGRDAGRMARHLQGSQLPAGWTHAARCAGERPDTAVNGALFGVPFGQLNSDALRAFLKDSDVKTLRVLPNRRLLAMGASQLIPDGFCAPDDPLLNVHACTGAPGCVQAFGPTRAVARRLAADLPKGQTLHVSGCAKGCAFPRPAELTYVATRDGFDLVSKGAPWDAPTMRGLSAEALLTPTRQG